MPPLANNAAGAANNNSSPGASGQTAAAQTEAEKAEAERAAMEKKLTEAERKLKEEEQKEAKNAQPASEHQGAATVPPVPPQPKPAETETTVPPGSTCAAVWLSTPAGDAALEGIRILMIEQPDTSSATMYSGRTNAKGRWHSCGLTAGHLVRVTVFGPRGMPLGSRTQTLGAGFNVIQLQLDRLPGPAPQQDSGSVDEYGRKRPRFQRP
jgi:hypothetical protein